MLTMGNLFCGFAAVHFALRAMFAAGAEIDASADITLSSALVERMLPSFLAIGAMLIFLGMLFDMLDGLAARLTNQVSAFGAQADSLADVVTFGVAPAILAVALMMRELHADQVMVTPTSEHVLGRVLWVCAAAYCICTAIRLARFNVEHAREDTEHRSFHGLPSPGAAAVLASVVMLHEHAGPVARNILVWMLPVVSLGCGFLMISRVPYERITQVYLVGRRPFNHVAMLMVVLIVFWAYKPQTLAVLCALYALSGPAITVARRMRSARTATDNPESAPESKSRRKSG
jgi:CDP-diacylglycerol---serine O-phosphatidyltransferase